MDGDRVDVAPQAGRLRPLAVASRKRIAGLPETPTLQEAGGPAVEMPPWAALVTLAGTPAAALDWPEWPDGYSGKGGVCISAGTQLLSITSCT